MVGVAQWSEHWTVAPGVGGSSPLTHPKNIFSKFAVSRHERLALGKQILTENI